MSFDILKPNNLLLGKILAIAASSFLFGCTLDPYIITAEEEYTRNFIKDFGLIDEKQDWNLAKTATVSVNLGPEVRKSVKVYGNYGGNFYLVADLTDISGKIEVPVDLPKVCNDIMVVTGDRKYYGNLGSTIDCSDMSRGVPNATYNDDGTAKNPNPAVYTNTEGNYTVTVQHTTRGNGKDTGYSTTDGGAYQYFNTQQMSPIISTTPWHEYYSINTQKKTENPNEWIGLLPESGKFNRLASDLNSWISKKKDEGQSIVEDFRINTSNDGSFTIFPYYYGTNLKHELGVYLLNVDGTPILKSGGTYDSSNDYSLDDFVSFPIFQDRAPGDLQVQARYDAGIQDIRINMNGITLTNDNPDVKKNTPLTFTLGENYNLEDYVEIKKDDEWVSYKTYIKNDGRKFHSRVAYHFWVDEPDKSLKHNPDSFARIDNNGYVTPLKITRDHVDGIAYANVAIATDLINSELGAGIGKIEGVELNYTYKVVPPGPIYSIDIAEDDLNMCVGQTKSLEVTLKDKDGNTLPMDNYIDKISVTDDWDTDNYRIFKDGNTIKITALAPGEFWPRVYENKYGRDNVFDYVHLTIINHSFSESHPGPDAAMSEDTWHGYFKKTDVVEQDILGYIEGSHSMEAYGGVKVKKEAFSEVTDEYSIHFKLSKGDNVKLAYNWWDKDPSNLFAQYYTYIVNKDEKTCDNDYRIESTVDEFDLPIQSWMIDGLQKEGLLIHGGKNGCEVIGLTLTRPAQEGEGGHVWTSDGQDNAVRDLTTYYTSNKPSGEHDCGNCGKENVDFSKATPTVSLNSDASYDNISYTVTWINPGAKATQSKHRAPARSRSVSSRELWEDADRKYMLTKDGENWKDVNSFWSRYLPKQEEVASYPPNVCMLARSRGYDVTITYGIDKDGNPKPWQGSLGMYLKVLGSYDIKTTSYKENGDGNYEEEYTPYVKNNSDKTKEEYVVFSQKKFNKGADGRSSDQISALSVKHPMSGRTFLTFEDMRLTRKDVTPADFYKEKSSDRDVNDLIFNITNYGDISNGKETITEKPVEGFSWLWAVEDLGSTDDFDFNDMVMKITTATKNVVKEEKKEEDGETTETTETTTTTTTLYKKVTFTPLCAGGTLPLYVHYSMSAETDDYTLRPGAYQASSLGYEIKDDSHKGTIYSMDEYLKGGGDDAAEIHRWFGVDNSTEMINTRSGAGIRKVNEGCTLYLPTDFTISGFGAEGGSIKGAKKNAGLYVTVNDENPVESIDEIETGVWSTEDGGNHWAIKAPNKLGSASQMFIIFDANTPWRWPMERVHILNPYPNFKEWVKDPDFKWYELNDGNKGYTFPRYDINK